MDFQDLFDYLKKNMEISIISSDDQIKVKLSLTNPSNGQLEVIDSDWCYLPD